MSVKLLSLLHQSDAVNGVTVTPRRICPHPINLHTQTHISPIFYSRNEIYITAVDCLLSLTSDLKLISTNNNILDILNSRVDFVSVDNLLRN